jgi:hypothetical protein
MPVATTKPLNRAEGERAVEIAAGYLQHLSRTDEITDVITALEEEHITGRRRSATECPLARGAQSELKRHGLDHVIVLVSDTSFMIANAERGSLPVRYIMSLPGVLRHFVQCFDAGLFPSLQEAEEASPDRE